LTRKEKWAEKFKEIKEKGAIEAERLKKEF